MFPEVDMLRKLAERASLSELSDLILFFASDAAVDVVWPGDDDPLGFASVTYLTRFKQRLIDAGKFDEDEVTSIMRHARAYAGGIASGDVRRRTDDLLEASELWQHNAIVDLEPIAAAETSMWIQVIPAAGSSFVHPRTGRVDFTHDMADEMVRNFKSGVYQEHIPIDAEHATKLSGALGYYRDLRKRDDGSIMARVELTDRGKALRSQGGFRYFSPEFFRKWTDPADSSKTYKNVLTGGAFTTRPLFKDKHLAPLVASEQYTVWKAGGSQMDKRWKQNEDGSLALDGDGNPVLTDEAKAAAEETAKTAAATVGSEAVTKFRGDHKLGEDGKPVEDDKGKDDLDKPKSFAEAYPQEAERVTAIEDENKRLKEESQRRRFTDVVRGQDGEGDGHPPFAGETEKHVTMLLSLSEKYGETSDEFGWYVKQNREHAEHTKALFTEIGSSGSVEPSNTEEDVVKKAEKLMKDDSGLTLGEAVSKVLEADPEVYAESLTVLPEDQQ